MDGFRGVFPSDRRDYTTPPGDGALNLPAAEAKDAPPVASGLDSTPTNWFELAADLCHQGHITETRMRRAIAAVRQGVDRA
jgi:hypothetical protein